MRLGRELGDVKWGTVFEGPEATLCLAGLKNYYHPANYYYSHVTGKPSQASICMAERLVQDHRTSERYCCHLNLSLSDSKAFVLSIPQPCFKAALGG